MEDKNYYDILGVSVKATAEEITAAKNTLAKRFHPDANLKDGIDTTQQMQNHGSICYFVRPCKKSRI